MQVVNRYADVALRSPPREPHPDAVPLVDSIARGEHYTELPELPAARNCSAACQVPQP
jgi:hypothetical protein